MTARKPGHALSGAMDRLAALYPYGALQVSTDPAGFVNAVADEIERLRAAPSAAPARETPPASALRVAAPATPDAKDGEP